MARFNRLLIGIVLGLALALVAGFTYHGLAESAQRSTTVAARLPESLEEPTLGSMHRGERAWTTPWAMWVDLQRRCWLHPGYTAWPQPRGTAEMAVRRLGDGTFEVDVRGLGPQWQPVASPSYVGEVDGWLPVSKLIT